MAEMNDRVALVTGAGAGIGRATALAFAAAGARLVLCDVDDDSTQETARMVRDIGREACPVVADVSDAKQAGAMVGDAIKRFGCIDFAFNNAGIEGQMATTPDCSVENWDRTLAVNLKGVWLCMKFELQHMLARKAGSIVNCSSVAGLVGFVGLPAYVASKHGVVGLTRTAALECAGRGVRVNAVCPGVIHTAMVDRLLREHPDVDFVALEPMRRMGSPEEIAAAVIWLCSDSSSFVTGQAIAVDGGFLAQ
ncbi:MAG TPA: glucose 1-dehydrogenase [Duganella sp.]|nr:glucose 1-dehydrogenase [Duganella sp.]